MVSKTSYFAVSFRSGVRESQTCFRDRLSETPLQGLADTGSYERESCTPSPTACVYAARPSRHLYGEHPSKLGKGVLSPIRRSRRR